MRKEIETVFKSFSDEFFERLELLLDAEKTDKRTYETVKLLMEYLELKYTNKLRYLENTSRLAKLIRNRSSFDPVLEEQLNHQLDLLTGDSNGNADTSVSLVEVKPHDLKLRFSKILEAHPRYSKTNLPKDIELAMIMDPYPNKDQDHIDFTVLPNGGVLMMICDGVSGDGPGSKAFAEELPQKVFDELRTDNGYYRNLKFWESSVINALERSIKGITMDTGSSTIILGYLHENRKDLYLSWLGDGNILLFNSGLTGYGKLLIPHQSESGKLTSVATSKGLIGDISSYTVRTNGGTLIMASDGFNLTNGRLLQHFYRQVLKSDQLQISLDNWTYGECCAEQSLHPEPSDDRSMIVLNWNV